MLYIDGTTVYTVTGPAPEACTVVGTQDESVAQHAGLYVWDATGQQGYVPLPVFHDLAMAQAYLTARQAMADLVAIDQAVGWEVLLQRQRERRGICYRCEAQAVTSLQGPGEAAWRLGACRGHAADLGRALEVGMKEMV